MLTLQVSSTSVIYLYSLKRGISGNMDNSCIVENWPIKNLWLTISNRIKNSTIHINKEWTEIGSILEIEYSEASYVLGILKIFKCVVTCGCLLFKKSPIFKYPYHTCLFDTEGFILKFRLSCCCYCASTYLHGICYSHMHLCTIYLPCNMVYICMYIVNT